MSGDLDESFVLIGANSGAGFTEAESIEAGIWTFRGRSFPFEAIFGVPMDRESVRPV